MTGAGSGLGRAMAEAFASEGATVCAVGRRPEKLQETVAAIAAAGGAALAFPADVRDAPRIEELMREAAARTGRIDVLVNNAAGNFVCPSEELSPNGFKSVVDIVLLGTFHCTRFAFEPLRRAGGAVVNIVASYAWSGEPGVVHSASAKAGVLAMTRTLAAEWGRFGIRVNAVAPGPIHTEGTDKNLWSVADVEEAVRRSVPLGRLGEPADVARAVLWLCSRDAAWISGATLAVDGAQWLHGGTLDMRRAYDAVRGAARPG
ncbi:MAG TPA: SDR family oxidoreductase [Candidatus Tumulicola sp.]|nr:SDR family oxidoreductase [Candidatus Tumulicola sp.]